jgi:hypothetical protein
VNLVFMEGNGNAYGVDGGFTSFLEGASIMDAR